MFLKCYSVLIVFCAFQMCDFHTDVTNDSQLMQSQILSAQEIKKIGNQLAQLFDLPTKKFKSLDRRKRMVKSETRFLLEMYENKHKVNFRQIPQTELWKQHKRTVLNSDYTVTFGAQTNGSYQTKSNLILNFKLSQIPKDYQFIAAELRLFRNKPSEHENRNFTILTYIIDKSKSLKLNEYLWTKHDCGWMVIDINNFFTNETANSLKIMITAKVDEKTVSVTDDVGISGLTGKLVERPFLVTYFNSEINFKVKLRN